MLLRPLKEEKSPPLPARFFAPPIRSSFFDTLRAPEAWLQVRERLGAETVRALAENAERLGKIRPRPRPKSTLYSHCNDYARTGSLKEYKSSFHERLKYGDYLAAAQALEPGGTYIPFLADWIDTLCDEPTWLGPAHALDDVQGRAQSVLDINSAMTAVQLALISQMFADRLSPRTLNRVRPMLYSRVTRPFLDGTHWWLGHVPGRRVNNFTPICCAAALAATLTTDQATEDEIQSVIAICLKGIRLYLETFAPDGGGEEGPSYWVYGMNYFVLAAEIMRGLPTPVDLYNHPLMPGIAAYPQAVAIGADAWITYSDCRQVTRWSVGTLAQLDRRVKAPGIRALARAHECNLDFLASEGSLLTNLLWWPEKGGAPFSAPQSHVYFEALELMIGRVDSGNPNAPIVTVRAGHNGQLHNHNDVGHLTYHLNGEPLLADLGAPEYERDYFSPKRCSYLAASSRGHSVPLINDKAQGRGPEFKGTVLLRETSPEMDRIEIELAKAYPTEAGIESLVRTVTLDRLGKPGSIHLTDRFQFESDNPSRQNIVSVLLTTSQVTVAEDSITIRGREPGCLSIAFDPREVKFELQTYPDVLLSESVTQVSLLIFRLEARTKTGCLALHIHPGEL